MATPSSLPSPGLTLSLESLSSELLALVFQQLRQIDPASLAVARRLCRRFDAIATPVAYHTLVLSKSLVEPDAENRYPRAFQHIAQHTNHVVARSDLDPQGIRRILAVVQKLVSLRWRYEDGEFCYGPFWMPSDVLSAHQHRRPAPELHVDGLPLRHFEGAAADTYIRSIPTDLLVSLKMAHPAHPLTTRLGSLKELLLRCRRLETFHHEDCGQGTQFAFGPGERLPAFTDLMLRHYDWRHSRESVAAHWDLSRLRSLRLVSVPIFNFLSSVRFSDLAGLHTLHADDFSAHLPTDRRQDAARALHVLVRDHVAALRVLSATLHTRLFPVVDALAPHAATLEALRLRDHVGFGDDDRRCPTLALADVRALARRLTRLASLELDMDLAAADPADGVAPFLDALAAFPALHTLALHVQTRLRPHGRYAPGADPDRDAALATFAALVRRRPPGAPAWRRVTVNVGGWKKVMVRRLAEAWRAQNRRGFFAERCFVLERRAGAGGRGPLVVREEICVESSRPQSPVGGGL